MSRGDGFLIADVDVGLYADQKVTILARRLRDPVKTAAYVALYLATVLESWSSGARATLTESAPAWWLDDLADAQRELEGAGLLDPDGRPGERAWSSWFGAAWERREKRRASGRRGGLASGASRTEASPEQSSSDASASLNPTDRPSVPPTDRPTFPTPTPPQRGRARDKRRPNGHATDTRAAQFEALFQRDGYDAIVIVGDCAMRGLQVRAADASIDEPGGRLVHVECPEHLPFPTAPAVSPS